MSALTLELTTPERNVLTETVDSATIPTAQGEITVLPGHIPLVANLATGMITVRRNTVESFLAVSGGFLEVLPDGRIVILADSADRAEDLDLAKVEEARERARKLLEEKRGINDVATAGALAALERELARVRVARHHRSRTRNIPSTR
jgi:F-type H+-transporting ATPase subunit epsilon